MCPLHGAVLSPVLGVCLLLLPGTPTAPQAQNHLGSSNLGS